ncbi:MAG: Sporulation-specific protease YabG [Firmicutes bacterium ADurb.Bin373]|nr:sporulation peptidase YabG [Bacillota bacterium]OQA10109.1 MAG: Sporulation-specific protease YabG [Firmicutes bacterium ADurb.Bin373]
MEEIKKGDVVGRRSYSKDIFFKVIDVYQVNDKEEYCKLKGIHYRLLADAPRKDLIKIGPGELSQRLREHTMKSSEHMKRIFARRERDREVILGRAAQHGHNNKLSNGYGENGVNGFDIPGTVLHIDGDSDYLDLCLTTYRQLSIPADGYNIEEKQQSEVVPELLKKHNPDLLVITGHDGFIKGKSDFLDINNYYSSRCFVEAVKAARLYEKSRDDLVIFAGACQSHYEAILNAGANFASSPHRVMIHAYDPVFVVEKIAYTSIYDPISIKEIITGTITGFNGIGGMETRGKYRFGVPKSPY